MSILALGPKVSPSVIQSVFEETDKEISKSLSRENNESGSTALLLLVSSDLQSFTIIKVGDSSSCVISRGGIAVKLGGDDHRINNKKEYDRVRKCGGIIRRNRLNGVLSVTRSFGDIKHKNYSKSDVLIVKPDIEEYNISKNDEFIVLATDGLFDVLTNQTVVNEIRKELAMTGNIEMAGEKVVKKALRAGSCDNISIIIVGLSPAIEK